MSPQPTLLLRPYNEFSSPSPRLHSSITFSVVSSREIQRPSSMPHSNLASVSLTKSQGSCPWGQVRNAQVAFSPSSLLLSTRSCLQSQELGSGARLCKRRLGWALCCDARQGVMLLFWTFYILFMHTCLDNVGTVAVRFV